MNDDPDRVPDPETNDIIDKVVFHLLVSKLNCWFCHNDVGTSKFELNLREVAEEPGRELPLIKLSEKNCNLKMVKNYYQKN